MDFTGYIEYNKKKYTFHYNKNYLTLIIINPKKESKDDWFYQFNSYEKIEYFKGFTSDGFNIYFYIDDTIRKWSGTYRCVPKLIFISKQQYLSLSKVNFKALKFTGGIVNRFYSNRILFENWVENIYDNQTIKFKDLKETQNEENIVIDSKNAIFQVSVSKPGWSDDGSIKIGNIDSVIRLIYEEEWKIEDMLNSILKMRDLFFFCMNRRCFEFEKITLEVLDDDNKYDETVRVYLPEFEQIKVPKNMVSYDFLQTKISDLLKVLDEVNYITYKVPKDDSEYTSITATTYVNTFSAYQAIYKYCYGDNNDEDENFIEIKSEILEELNIISDKYLGGNGKKRKILKRYINLIEKKTDFKLETSIMDELRKNNFILEALPDEKYKDILINMDEVIIEAVESRDLITHDDVFAPKDEDIAVYLVLERLIHILVLEKIGIERDKIEYMIKFLNQNKIL